MNVTIKSFLLAFATLLTPYTANAAVIWDWSPAAIGVLVGPDWFAQCVHVSLADKVIFPEPMTVTGIDIYMGQDAAVGQTGLISLWADNNGVPGLILSHFTDRVTAVDSDGAGPDNHRVHVDFSNPLFLNAHTPYWINMTSTLGTVPEWTQSTRRNVPGGDGKHAGMVSEVEFETLYPSGDLAFRLYGNPVPEPSTWVLAIVGFLGGFLAVRWNARSQASKSRLT